MIKDLAKLATRLDRLGLTKEADVLDAALNKLAQEVATTGVPGAEYADGKQITEGRPGGPTVKFYQSTPRTLSQFNQYLGELIKNVALDKRQSAFSPAVIANPPTKSDTTWTPRTQAAFKEYAIAAGFPEAGINWQEFAKKNKYAPSVLGVYKFWEDTVAEVDPEARLAKTFQKLTPSKNLQERAESFAQGPQQYLDQSGATPTESFSAQGAQGRLGSNNTMDSLKTRLKSYPIRDGLAEDFNAEFLFRKLQLVMRNSQAANDWFTKNPLDTVLPPNIKDILAAKINAQIATSSDRGVSEFYSQLLEYLGISVSTKQKFVDPNK